MNDFENKLLNEEDYEYIKSISNDIEENANKAQKKYRENILTQKFKNKIKL